MTAASERVLCEDHASVGVDDTARNGEAEPHPEPPRARARRRLSEAIEHRLERALRDARTVIRNADVNLVAAH